MKVDILGKVISKIGPDKITRLTKAKPKLMLAGGLIFIGAGVVAACRGTLKTEKDIKAYAVESEDWRRAEEHDGLSYRKEKVGSFLGLCGHTARNYIPAAICIGSGVALIIGSHNVMQSRIGMLSAAYVTLDEAYQGYRERVIEDLGEDADRKYRLGVEKKEIETTKVLKNGKEKTVKKAVNYIHNDGRPYSPYARYFDSFTAPGEWRNDPGYCDMFLRSQQSIANEQFQARGHLFLNEVYKMLGMPEIPEGQLVGWYKGMGDDFVDFGLLEVVNEKARDYVNGPTECFVLDFNVDGPIWDLL